MIKINKKTIIFIALIIITTLTFTNNVFAVSNPSEWDPHPSVSGGSSFINRAGFVLGWIKYIGIIISVLTLAFIGIKYMFCSVEGKAEYKKTMFPYLVGCFMLMGTSLIIGIIESLAKA